MRILAQSLTGFSVLLLPALATAHDFPSKPITADVPFPTGGRTTSSRAWSCSDVETDQASGVDRQSRRTGRRARNRRGGDRPSRGHHARRRTRSPSSSCPLIVTNIWQTFVGALSARHRPAAVAADGGHGDRHLAERGHADRPLCALRHHRSRRPAGDLCDRRPAQIQLQGRAPQRKMGRRHRRRHAPASFPPQPAYR